MDFDDAGQRDRVRRFWQAPAIADRAGPEGGRSVRARSPTAGSRRCGSWRPIRRSACRAPTRCARALDALPVRRRLRLAGRPTPRATPTSCCRRSAWGEKDGTVTNSERRISRQRASCRRRARRGPTGGCWPRSRAAWASARRSLIDPPADIFREHAALSGFENDGARAISTSRRSRRSTTPPSTRWSRCNGRCRARPGGAPRACSPTAASHPRPPRALRRRRAAGAGATRRRRLPAGAQHRPRARPVAHHDAHRRRRRRLARPSRPSRSSALHPARRGAAASPTAPSRAHRQRLGQHACSSVAIRSGQRPARLFVPMHWSDASGFERARIDALVIRRSDPISGQPELKAHAGPHRAGRRWRSAALRYRAIRLDVAGGDYWVARHARAGGWRFGWPAGRPRATGAQRAARDVRRRRRACECQSTSARGIYRAAAFDGSSLLGCLFIGPPAQRRHGDWLEGAARAGRPATPMRGAVLAGRPSSGLAGADRSICACFGVGDRRIRPRDRAPGCRPPRRSAQRCAPAPIAAPACPRSARCWPGIATPMTV